MIRITADSAIDDDEIPEMVRIQSTLERLSIMIEALQLCIEKKLDNGEINKAAYETALDEIGG